MECHPHYRQKELIKFCNAEGIHIQAYSSLGTSINTNLLKDPVVNDIALELNVSPARLLLKWALQQGIGKCAIIDMLLSNIIYKIILFCNSLRCHSQGCEKRTYTR